jgi:hypothetical protein
VKPLPSTTGTKLSNAWVPGFAALALAASLASSRPVSASQPVEAVTQGVPCAIIEEVSGAVQLLDVSRTLISEAGKRTPVACGSWVSVGQGWIKLRLRDGFTVHLSADSFAELPESNLDGKNQGEQVVIYRGQLYARNDSGASELRVLTANGRARLTRGAMAVLYNREGQESQLIALENVATLENRFQKNARVSVRAGEATSLSLDLQRVVPASPRAVAIASLRERLTALKVSDRDRSAAIRVTQVRHERKIASALEEMDAPAEHSAVKSKSGSKPAARGKKPQRKTASATAYVRSQAHPEDASLQDHMRERMTGGVDAAELRARAKEQKDEQKEKRRLIEELSKIKEE